MKLVIYPAVDDERLANIEASAGGMDVVNVIDEESAVREVAGADAFFGRLTAPMLAAATKLRWVQSPTASLEHYVFPELVEHCCTLTNMRGLNYDVIADHVFAYILCFARRLHIYLRKQMRAEWGPIGGVEGTASFFAGPGTVSPTDRAHLHVGDQTLGIVGLGSIGSEIARRGRAFSMRVLAVDPMATAAPEGVEALWKLDRLGDLLAESDFLVVAAPHTPDTERMFRRAQFRAMKRTAYFINVGRGAIVSLDDLVQSLEANEIAGAALDVFEVEPLPAGHPLWKMENVIITPHMAAASVRIAGRHLEVLLDNVGRFARGEELRNVVSKEKWF